MSDIRLAYNSLTKSFDFALAGSDLAIDDGLETAVAISLCSDRRANPDDGVTDVRGWWADTYPDTGDRIGSRLWLLAREKQTQAALNRAREYALESLQWLIDDGAAGAIDVVAEIVSPGVLGLGVQISRNNQPVAQYRFEKFWGNI